MAVNLSLILGAKGGSQTKSEIDGVTGSVKKLDGAAAGAGSGGLAKLGNALLSGVKVAATAALAALTALGTGIVSSTMKAADMEQKVADIASVMGLAKDETAPLAALIKDLGIDPKLKVSATEAGVAIENLAKNGLSMTDILDGAARSTVLLANATGADFETAANVATDTMALFKIKADDMKGAVDGITAVTIASKFGIQDYALALAQGGGVASSVGVDFKDFNTTIAAISPFFASGSDAGTSFKVMLQNLIPKSQEAEDLMKQLGLMTADGANAFYDASGNMKSMSEISALLNKALGGLTEEQKNQTLSTLFGTDAMRAAFGLMGAGEVVYTDAAKAASELGVSQELVNTMMDGGITKYEALQLQMSKGDAEKSAATRMDTLRGALEILSGVFETLQIGIGEKFVPVFRLMVDRISAFLSDNANDIIGWAGSLADGLQGLITTQLPLIIAKLGEWWNAGKQVADSIRQIGALNTVWQGVTDLVTVATAHLATWANTLFAQIVASLPSWIEKFKQWGAAAWQWIVDATPVAVAKLVEWGNAVLSWLTSNLPTWLAKLKEWGVAAWKWISDATPSTVTILAEWGRQLLGWLTSNLTTWLARLKEWGVALMTWISDAIAPSLGKMNDWTNQLFGWLTSNLPTWLAKLKEWGVAAWKWISDATPSAVTILAEWGRQLLSWLTSNLPSWLAKLKEWGVAAWNWIVEATPSAVAVLGEWGRQVVGWLTSNLPTWLARLREWGNAIWGWIVDATPSAVAILAEWGRQLLNWLTSNLPTWLAKLKEWGASLMTWISDAITPSLAKMNDWTNQLMTWVANALPGWAALFPAWGAALVTWIVDAIPPTVAKIAAWGSAVLAWVTDNLPTWVAKLKEWGVAAWDWLAKAIPATVIKLGEWGGSLFRWLGEHLPDLLATLLEWGTALISWIGDAIPGAIAAFTDWLTAVNDWDEQSGAPGLAQMAAQWVDILIQWIASDLIPKVGPAFLDLSAAMLKALGKIVVELGAAALKLGVTIIAAIVEGLADLVSVDLSLADLKKNIIDTIDNWRTAIYGAGAAVTRRIGEGIRSLLSDPQGAINSVIDNARTSADGLMTTWSTKLKEQGSAAVTSLQSGVAAVKDGVRTEVAKTLKDIEDYGLAEGLGKMAGRMYEAARQGLLNLSSGFTNQAPTAKQDMQTVLNSVQGAIGGGLDNISKSIADWAGPAATKFYNGAKDLITKFLDGWNSAKFDLGGWTSSITSTLAAWITNGASDFKNAGLNLISSFINGWNSGTFNLSQWLNDGISGALRDWLNLNRNSIGQWAGDIGKEVVAGIGAGITGASATLRDALTYLANLLPQWAKDALGIHSPSTVFRAIGQNIIEGLTQGIEDLAAQPQIALSGAVTGLAPAAEAISRQNISTVNNSSVVQNYFTIAERGGGQMDIAERVRLLNMMYG